MSELVPSGVDTGGAEQLLASARARLSVALADLALPAGLRLTEWQRTTIAALLARLVRSVEDELRSALSAHFSGKGSEALHAALSSAHVPIAEPVLEGSAAHWEPALVEVLIRRAEEHRFHKILVVENALLLDLVGDEDEAVAGDAMALLIAQSGRLDRFQEPLIARAELSAEIAHSLVWTVAAALRRYLIGQHGVEPAAADSAIAAAAGELLAGYDEGETFGALCLRLAKRLEGRGRLDDAFVGRAFSEGSLPLFVAALSVRTGLDPASAWELISERGGRGPALLLRSAGIGRSEAGALLYRLSEDEAAIAAQVDLYDTTSAEEAGRLLGLWRADPGYRAAIARLAA